MKPSLFHSLIWLTLGIAGCSGKSEPAARPIQNTVVDVVVNATYPLLESTVPDGKIALASNWRETDKLGVFARSRTNSAWLFGSNRPFELNAEKSSGSYGVFKGQFETGGHIAGNEAHDMVYHAYYPYHESPDTSTGVFSIVLSDTQYPTLSAHDPCADFLMGTVQTNAKLGYMEKGGENVVIDFTLTCQVAVVMLNFLDIPSIIEGEMLNNLTLTAGGAGLAGNIRVNLVKNSFEVDGDASESVTLIYEDGIYLDDNYKAWFAMMPAEIRKFVIQIETENYYIEKEVDNDGGFSANTLTCRAVSLETADIIHKNPTDPDDPDSPDDPDDPAIPAGPEFFYRLRTDLPDFSGDYIIVYTDSGKAMSAISDHGGYVNAVDISVYKEPSTGFIGFEDGVPEFTYTIAKVTEGAHQGKYTIHNSTLGYLQSSAARNDSAIEFVADVSAFNDYAYWAFSVNGSDGSADILCGKLYTDNSTPYKLQFSDIDSPERFSAYAGTRKNAILFRRFSEGETIRLAAPVPAAEAGIYSYTVTWPPVDDACGYTVSTDRGASWSEPLQNTEFRQNGLGPEENFTVWVKAVGSGIYSDSACAEISGTTQAVPEPVYSGYYSMTGFAFTGIWSGYAANKSGSYTDNGHTVGWLLTYGAYSATGGILGANKANVGNMRLTGYEALAAAFDDLDTGYPAAALIAETDMPRIGRITVDKISSVSDPDAGQKLGLAYSVDGGASWVKVDSRNAAAPTVFTITAPPANAMYAIILYRTSAYADSSRFQGITIKVESLE